MKKNPIELSQLFDLYGNMLTDKQKDAFDLYYNQDLSLSEIAELMSITRQGVRDLIVRGEATINELETKLSLFKKSVSSANSKPEIIEAIENASILDFSLINELEGAIKDIKALNDRRLFSDDLEQKLDNLLLKTEKLRGI